MTTPPEPLSPRGYSLLDEPTSPDVAQTTIVTPTPDFAGQVLDGRYTLVQRIGRGGMGVIYLASDAQLPRPVAIKILLSRDPVVEQRFQDEIEILGTLTHASLVQPHGWGRTPGGQLYMAMEYIRGENLRERLVDVGPLTCREALACAIAVGEVLLVLHASGVLHRDIKPNNIMLVSSAAGVVVKLIDLGCAKKQAPRWPTGPAGRFVTPESVSVGTPGYLAPEAGLVPADPRLDVYALAATLYELCTGHVPQSGGPYRPIEAPPGECPPELDAVLAAALASEPTARTPTVEALVAGLRRVRDASIPSPLFDGRYELLRRLGKGGKAEAWLAAHRHTRRDVALKRLLPGKDNEEEVRRLHQEACVLAALQHPAFPDLYDLHEHCGELYLVMARARGQPASKYVLHPLSQAHVLDVGIQLARALISMHALGVLHRDLHGDNILIDFEAGPKSRPVVTILDLGQCALLPAWYAREQRYATPPERRVPLGSGGLEKLPWTAPEARRGAGWSEKSDVWSAARLLYMLLTGHAPVAPGEDTPTSARQHVPDCEPDLDQALLVALHPDPAKRLDAAGLLKRLVDAAELRDAEAAEAARAVVEAVRAAADEPPASIPTTAQSEPVPVDRPPVRQQSGTTDRKAEPVNADRPSTPTSQEPVQEDTSPPKSGGTDRRAAVSSPALDATLPRPAQHEASEIPRHRPRPGLRHVLLAGAAGLLGVVLVSTSGLSLPDSSPARPPESAQPLPPVSAVAQRRSETLSAPPSALAALETARPALRGCASESFTIEVASDPNADRFAEPDVLGAAAVAACARPILASLRFAPGPAERITVEIAP